MEYKRVSIKDLEPGDKFYDPKDTKDERDEWVISDTRYSSNWNAPTYCVRLCDGTLETWRDTEPVDIEEDE